MHHLGKLTGATADAGPYGGHSDEHVRIPLVDRAAGSVHQEIVHAELGPGGSVARHLHAYEEGLYLLEGRLRLEIAGTTEELAADDFLFVHVGVPHSLANPASEPARWLEVHAPQPGADLEDTVFVADGAAGAALEAPYQRGHFDLGAIPAPSDAIGLEGFGAANVGGASLTMLVDRNFGATQFNLFVVQYVPGGLIKEHDHPFEEAFFFVAGEVEALLDGETHTVRAGEYCWSGVGSMHALTNRSDAPVRWLETQVPQPPSAHQARFKGDWERLIGAA